MQLLGNRILIVPNTPQDQINGIWIPDQLKQQRNSGLVVLIGDEVDKKYDKTKVLFDKVAKVEMTYENIPCVMVYRSDIIAILD